VELGTMTVTFTVVEPFAYVVSFVVTTVPFAKASVEMSTVCDGFPSAAHMHALHA
jgi:hypothetical protein